MKKRTRTEYSILNILTGIGGYILNTILGFICRMIFVRCLSADYLGVNGLFTNLLTILSLAELGVGSAIVYALYKPLAEDDEEKITVLVTFYGKAYRVIGIVIAAFGLCFLPFINLIIREEPNIVENLYLIYFINLFNTASTYFFSYRSSLIIAAQKNYVVTGVSYIISVLQSALQVGVLLVKRDYLLYLLIQTVCTLVYNVLISQIALKMFPYLKKKNVPPLSQEESKSIYRNVRDLLIYKISSLLVNNTDNILITFFDGLSITGIISNYTLLVSTLTALINQIFGGLTASVGNHNAIESSENRYNMFSFLNMMNFWLFGWGTIGILCCSNDLVHLCFGEKYVLNFRIPLIIGLNFYTVGLLNAVWTYKHTMGLFRYGRFIQFGTGILNIIFSVLFGKKFGVFGILLATLVSRLCTSIWYDPYIIYKYGFEKKPQLYLKKYIYYLWILVVAIALCFLSVKPIHLPILLQVIVKILLCSIVTNLVFYISLKNKPEFQKMKQIIQNVLLIFRR